jgi:PilZ domain
VVKLHPGDWAEFELPGSDPPLRFRGMVTANEAGECTFAVRAPEEGPFPIGRGAPLTLRFVSALGLHIGGCYVVRLTRGGPEIELTASEPTTLETIQRRAFYRVSAALPVQLVVLESTVDDLDGAVDRQAITVDLSAGGIKVTTALALEVDDLVRFTLVVPPEFRFNLPDFLACDAHILRREEAGLDRYRVAMQSVLRNEIDRDKWVQLTLNLQRARD